MAYKLSSTLKGHSSDVRAIVSPSPTLVLSASRDSTAVVWTRPDDKAAFSPATIYKPSERYVNAIAYLPPTTEAPRGYIITGSQDSIINVYIIGSDSADPSYTLLGHQHNVCSLDTTPGGLIVSGSWDQSARVWKDFQPLYELKGHAASVLAVLALNEDEYLTASADKTVKLWKHHKEISTFRGHTDAVRGLALLPEIGFASCSNDGDIRVWTPEGDVIFVLSGHTSFVYSVAVLPSGDIVSSGEDRTVRVWKDGECAQTIVHPAISVWTVSAMPNGDIVSGASDYAIRVFSPAQERWASEGDLKAFDDLVASHAIPTQAAGDSIDTNKLPGEEVLSQPGKKEGENKLVKTATGAVDVYTWTGGQWMKVGQMTDAVGSTEKKTHNGKEWDYVFEVDVADGAPKLKLPYNANENAYVAAQRFLDQNDLPRSYLDQVVKFIEQQTAGLNIASSNNQFVDPYTGASRYQASPSSFPAGSTNGAFSDPFTGGSRYQPPSAAPQPAPVNISSGDPFTGGSRYNPAGQAPLGVTPTSSGILPVRDTLSFKQCNVPAMRTKLLQMNEGLKSDVTTATIALSRPEVQVFERIFTYLNGVVSSPSPPAQPDVEWKDVEIILQVIARWPESQIFPLIDLFRLMIFYCPNPKSAPADLSRTLEVLLTVSHWRDQSKATEEQPTSKTRETNILLALRAFANTIQISPNGSIYGAGIWSQKLFAELSPARYELLNKNQRVAFATLLFNFSCVELKTQVITEAQQMHFALVIKILKEEKADAETAYRALVALGNTIHAQKLKDQSLLPVVEALPSTFAGDQRIRSLSAEIKSLITA